MHEDNHNNFNSNKENLDSFISYTKTHNDVDKNANGLQKINKSFQAYLSKDNHQIL